MKITSRVLPDSIRAVCIILGLILPVSSNAQDHGSHVQPEEEAVQDHNDHQASGPTSMHDHSGSQMLKNTMQEAMVMSVTGNASMANRSAMPRDPHAYSGGYARTEGPYALPPAQQLHLADESTLAGVWIDRLESREGGAENYQELSGYAWLGNSYQRYLMRTEFQWRDQTIEESQTELLYSRAFSRLWNVELGARFDTGDAEHREWLAFGVAGLAPYWFDVRAVAYLSPEGHSGATFEAEYDLLLGQRLILQPRAEVDFYGDSDLDAGHGKGLSKSILGVRMRYEITRQFAPYVGYERVRHHGEAASVFQPFGQHNEEQWMVGFRIWF